MAADRLRRGARGILAEHMKRCKSQYGKEKDESFPEAHGVLLEDGRTSRKKVIRIVCRDEAKPKQRWLVSALTDTSCLSREVLASAAKNFCHEFAFGVCIGITVVGKLSGEFALQAGVGVCILGMGSEVVSNATCRLYSWLSVE